MVEQCPALEGVKGRVRRIKFRVTEELSAIKTAVLVTLGVAVPFMVGGLLIPYIGFVFILLALGWIPYSVWVVLVYYYRRKDQIRDEARIRL